MDRLLAPHSLEATAQRYLNEDWFHYADTHPSLSESLISGDASYQSFSRYLTGADLFLLPRSKRELESVLRRYAYDAIHNAIALGRTQILPGGYSRMCQLAEKSIHGVLAQGDNAAYLLSLHRPTQQLTKAAVEADKCHMPNSIKAVAGL